MNCRILSASAFSSSSVSASSPDVHSSSATMSISGFSQKRIFETISLCF